ncbi:MAG: hypothetical protein WDO24_17100 [Pseudomonadota bacterium]
MRWPWSSSCSSPGRIVALLGVALALAFVPVLTMIGFAALAITPSLGVIAVFQVLRRAAEYAITRPAREVIYTVVPREDRYKTKGFIDTFVYRLGDQAGAWSSDLAGPGSRTRHAGRDRRRGAVAPQRAVARPPPADPRNRRDTGAGRREA